MGKTIWKGFDRVFLTEKIVNEYILKKNIVLLYRLILKMEEGKRVLNRLLDCLFSKVEFNY